MVVVVGDGSKLTNVVIENVKVLTFGFDFISPEGSEIEAKQRNEESSSYFNPEYELEIDGIRIPKSSISFCSTKDKKNTIEYHMMTILYHFVYLSDEFPIKKKVSFYRPNETIPSLCSQIIITGNNSLGRDYEFFSSDYIQNNKQ